MLEREDAKWSRGDRVEATDKLLLHFPFRKWPVERPIVGTIVGYSLNPMCYQVQWDGMKRKEADTLHESLLVTHVA